VTGSPVHTTVIQLPFSFQEKGWGLPADLSAMLLARCAACPLRFVAGLAEVVFQTKAG